MIRALIVILIVAVPLWAPWMDKKGNETVIADTLEAFGPLVAVCFDGEGNTVADGLQVSWYPFGRLVHTCSGDYVVWMWGEVKEVGGVAKSTSALQDPLSRPLSCSEIIRRQDVRQASTTAVLPELYEGEPASSPDYSIFPLAREHDASIRAALQAGPNFAGKFSVAEWECGSNCKDHAVVDVETGRVVAYNLTTEYGVAYTVKDTLFTTNPLENLPPPADGEYEAENQLFSIARVPREYYRLTTDALSGTQYLVKLCVESTATGYVGVRDDRLGIPDDGAVE